MPDLNAPEWEDLGNEVSELLRQLAGTSEIDDEFEEAWFELMESLHHQGTIYAATIFAIPHLRVMATDAPPAIQTRYLGTIGYWAICATWHGFDDELTSLLRAELALCEPMAQLALTKRPLQDAQVIDLLRLIAAANGCEPVARSLDYINDLTIEAHCPQEMCGATLTIDRDGPDLIIAEGEGETASVSHHAAIKEELAWDETTAATNCALLARKTGRRLLSQAILALDGRATCPTCSEPFHLLKEILHPTDF